MGHWQRTMEMSLQDLLPRTGKRRWKVKNCQFRYLQFDGFIPIDRVSGQDEWFDVDNVYVASLCADVEPLALEW